MDVHRTTWSPCQSHRGEWWAACAQIHVERFDNMCSRAVRVDIVDGTAMVESNSGQLEQYDDEPQEKSQAYFYILQQRFVLNTDRMGCSAQTRTHPPGLF